MPLHPSHILRFLSNVSNEKDNTELLNLLIKRINNLCFNECQVDRVACTLTPLCSRRFLLRLRIKNGLKIDDLPKFCYSVLKGVIERDFRGKTVVYKPFDSYLYLVDFLDIFFHGDYRKLNKFLSFKKWDDAFQIFNDRILYRNENFEYQITDNFNFLIFKFEDRLNIIYIDEGYVICNANRENITNLELLKGICELYKKIYFPDVQVALDPSDSVLISIIITNDILSKVKPNPGISNERDNKLMIENIAVIDSKPEGYSKLDYFWKVFSDDLESLMQFMQNKGFSIWQPIILIKKYQGMTPR